MMKKESKERYTEDFEEGSELLWPSDKEDSVTRKFYRDISHLSKISRAKKIKTNLIEQIFRIIFGRGGSTLGK